MGGYHHRVRTLCSALRVHKFGPLIHHTPAGRRTRFSEIRSPLNGAVCADRHSYPSEGGFFKARLTFPSEFPIQPPKLRFITPMWHPNSAYISSAVPCESETQCNLSVYADGNVCISILVRILNPRSVLCVKLTLHVI